MKSVLNIKTENKSDRTVLTDLYFTAPYKIMSPFFDGNHMDIMQMCASAGLLSGDVFELQLDFGEKTDVTYLSQSYDKIFKSKGEKTKKNVLIRVGENACVKYMPFPLIPFEGSDFLGENDIYIHSSSTLMYCDVFSCGRVGMGEKFLMKCFHSKSRFYVDNQMVFFDNVLINPSIISYQTMGMWSDYTHNGMCFMYFPDEKLESEVIKKIKLYFDDNVSMQNILYGMSHCKKGIVLRLLSSRGEWIWNVFEYISNLI